MLYHKENAGGRIMLSSFKNALSKLTVYSEDELREKYEEEERNSQIEDTQKEGQTESKSYKLSELMQELDKTQKKRDESDSFSFDIDKLIARIDAKIAELEREEKEQRNVIQQFGEKIKDISFPKIDLGALLARNDMKEPEHQEGKKCEATDTPVAWLTELMPKQGFSIGYSRIYITSVLNDFVRSKENPQSCTGNDWHLKQVTKLPNQTLRNIAIFLCNIITALYTESTPKVEAIIEKEALKIKREIRNTSKQFVKRNTFTHDDSAWICFIRDVFFLVLSISKHSKKQNLAMNWAEARAYVYYNLANGFLDKEAAHREGLWYAKQGLLISNPKDRQDAFNVLGVCAIKTRGCKQLAYDAYYSWVFQSIVGEIIPLLPAGYTMGDEEAVWRCEEGQKETALMHANYSYVCGTIADTYERDTERWHAFSGIALDQIREAIELNEDSSYFCTRGTLLSERNMPDSSFKEAIEQYRKCYKTAKSDVGRLTATRCLIHTLIDEMVSSLYRWDNKNESTIQEWASSIDSINVFRELKDLFTKYQAMILRVESNPDVDEGEKKNQWKPFMDLILKLGTIDTGFEIKLLMVDKLCNTMMGLLKRREYSSVNYYTRIAQKDTNISPKRTGIKPIAYYTTMATAKHLFDVLYRENNNVAPSVVKKDAEHQYKDGLNCLTMMHAHYMNDPTEGMAFVNFVCGDDPYSNELFYRGDGARFRKDIFNKYNVFLKSFTDKMDNLHMWNRYASDRSADSRDSNGCCIQFNTDFFDKVNDSEVSENNNLLDNQDDYALYRVIYVSEKGMISEEKNPGLSPYVHGCYTLLIKLLREINGDLNKINVPDEMHTERIRSYVQSVLKKVIFLFKYDDYAGEAEYRLVVTRSHDHLEGIRLISSEPDMLCINPYFQICIDKVILGPNVTNTDPWSIYFRYQMALMWQRALRHTENEQMPELIIEKSKIHYHT